MNRKKILEKRLTRLGAKKKTLAERAAASTDVAEVRALTAELEDLNAEIEETRDEIAAIDAETRTAGTNATGANAADPEVATRAAIPANATLVNPRTVATTAQTREETPLLESMEYREAFRAFVQRGVPMPSEIRGEAISTSETGPAIPITIMNEVINTVRKRYGNLYRKVRKFSVPGGLEIPIGSLKATFKWINESTVSPRQKLDALDRISFGYHTSEIRVAQTFLSYLLTLSAFEEKLAEVIAIAYLEAMDKGIVLGSGNGCMTGILNDTRIPAANVIEMTAADFGDWTAWRKKFFAKLPLGYRAGEFIFPLSTVETYFETMHDANNNPVFRQATGLEVNDGDAQNPNGRFFGREINLVEPDVLPDFDTASANDAVGLFGQPWEYGINENFGFTMRRYFDEETNEWVVKALVVVDGKILNPMGFYKIVKKAG